MFFFKEINVRENRSGKSTIDSPGSRLAKGRKSYDFRLILRPLTNYVCDCFTKFVGMFFYDFRFVVVTSSFCGVTKIGQFTRAAHLSLNSYIRSNKILNIVILLVYVDTSNNFLIRITKNPDIF